MKGFVLFSIVLAILVPLYNIQRKDLFEVEGISSIYFVLEEDGKQVIELQEKGELSQTELSKADGIILSFEGAIVDEVFDKLNAKAVKEEVIEGMRIVYGYTNLYSGFIYIDGKQANVQLVQKQNEVIAGFPIILSGF